MPTNPSVMVARSNDLPPTVTNVKFASFGIGPNGCVRFFVPMDNPTDIKRKLVISHSKGIIVISKIGFKFVIQKKKKNWHSNDHNEMSQVSIRPLIKGYHENIFLVLWSIRTIKPRSLLILSTEFWLIPAIIN